MLDQNIRVIANTKNNIIWNAYEDNNTYGWYYAESRIYLLRSMKTDVMSIVSAGDPKEALTKVLAENCKWNDVKETQPTDGVEYIVSRKDGIVNTGFWFLGDKSFKEGYNGKVVAWMPLPEPYKQ